MSRTIGFRSTTNPTSPTSERCQMRGQGRIDSTHPTTAITQVTTSAPVSSECVILPALAPVIYLDVGSSCDTHLSRLALHERQLIDVGSFCDMRLSRLALHQRQLCPFITSTRTSMAPHRYDGTRQKRKTTRRTDTEDRPRTWGGILPAMLPGLCVSVPMKTTRDCLSSSMSRLQSRK